MLTWREMPAQDGLWWKDENWEFPREDWANPGHMWFADVKLVEAGDSFNAAMSISHTTAMGDEAFGGRYARSHSHFPFFPFAPRPVTSSMHVRDRPAHSSRCSHTRAVICTIGPLLAHLSRYLPCIYVCAKDNADSCMHWPHSSMHPSKRMTSTELMSMAPKLFDQDTVAMLSRRFEEDSPAQEKKSLVSSLKSRLLSTLRFRRVMDSNLDQPSLVIDVQDGAAPAPAPEHPSSTIAWGENAEETSPAQPREDTVQDDMKVERMRSNNGSGSGNDDNLNPRAVSQDLCVEDMFDPLRPAESVLRDSRGAGDENFNPPGLASSPKEHEHKAPNGAPMRAHAGSTHDVRRSSGFPPATTPGFEQQGVTVASISGDRVSQKDMSPTSTGALLPTSRQPRPTPKAEVQEPVLDVGGELEAGEPVSSPTFLNSPVSPPPSPGISMLACTHALGRKGCIHAHWQTSMILRLCRVVDHTERSLTPFGLMPQEAKIATECMRSLYMGVTHNEEPVSSNAMSSMVGSVIRSNVHAASIANPFKAIAEREGGILWKASPANVAISPTKVRYSCRAHFVVQCSGSTLVC